MAARALIPHGDYVKPQYVPAKGRPAGWAGQSTDAERKGGAVSGIVERFDKHKRASDTPIAFGLIKGVYRDAVEYTGRPEEMRGLATFMGLLTGAIAFYFVNDVWHDAYHTGLFELVLGGLIAIPLFTLGGIYGALRGIRTDFFSPQDEPVIFDRKNRKVYRIFQEVQPGARGLLRRWPLRACEYDWDLIDVEHNARVVTTGSTVTRYHSLIFIVRRSASDPTIIDSFNIGNSMVLGELTVAPVWEHIRRYMEEKGPALPPEEVVRPPWKPRTLLQAVADAGRSYKRMWREESGFMVLAHVLFPLFLPINFFWALFNWLSELTVVRIAWPEQVREAIGVPVEDVARVPM